MADTVRDETVDGPSVVGAIEAKKMKSKETKIKTEGVKDTGRYWWKAPLH
jgi:hypothetical protein